MSTVVLKQTDFSRDWQLCTLCKSCNILEVMEDRHVGYYKPPTDAENVADIWPIDSHHF